jgi:hypothetical protein
LFRFNIETGSLGVSKQPKQTKDQPKHQNKPKQTGKKCLASAHTKKQPKQIKFQFISVRKPEKN